MLGKLNFQPTLKTLSSLFLGVLIFVEIDESQQANMCFLMYIVHVFFNFIS